MEIKKSEKYDLERKKPVYVQIGLVLALSLALFSFEYKSYDKEEKVEVETVEKEVLEEFAQQTKQEKPPEAPPVAQVQTTLLNIVDNNVQVENDIEISSEDDGARNNDAIQEVAAEVVVDAEETEIFQIVEESPEYPGGDEARMKYLKDNLNYPQLARESGIDGTVYIQFVVETNGSISKAVILRDIGGGCGDEALRVVKGMPKWKPGKQRGKAVRTEFKLPVKFVLN